MRAECVEKRSICCLWKGWIDLLRSITRHAVHAVSYRRGFMERRCTCNVIILEGLDLNVLNGFEHEEHRSRVKGDHNAETDMNGANAAYKGGCRGDGRRAIGRERQCGT